jgi:hypothetical protein
MIFSYVAGDVALQLTGLGELAVDMACAIDGACIVGCRCGFGSRTRH